MVSAVYQVTCGVTTTLGSVSKRVVGRHRLDGEHVQAGRCQPPRRQGFGQRGLVDDRTARGVDQHGVRLHQRQRLGVDQARGCVDERQVQRHDVADGEQVRQGPPARGVRRRACWCAARRRPSPSRSSPRAWRRCRSRPGRPCSCRCRAPSHRASGPTASLVRPGWPHRVRATDAARRASAAPRPRRPTGRWRRACWPPRCRVAWRCRRRWCSRQRPACAPAGNARRARGRRRQWAQHVPDDVGARATSRRRSRRRPRRRTGHRANLLQGQGIPAPCHRG